MLKTVNLFRLGVQCCGNCRNIINRVSTSAIVLKRESNILKEKLKFLEEEKKKYEDTFGDIESFETKFQKIQDDPEDIAEYEQLKQAKGKTLFEYKKEISELLSKHQYREAIRVLEVDMVNDKIKSDIGIYRMLFNYTALKGDLDEAYRLYVRYRRRQGRMTGPMYTSLFNACANSKNSFSALKKAEIIRQNLAEDKFHKVNIFNYNSMLKDRIPRFALLRLISVTAFGRHGDLPTCLKIFDEVLHKRLKAFTHTYNFLLQSCISDRNSGLRHALMVWRKMLQNRRKPDIWFFNLFLRCVRDCSLGDVELIPNLIQQINKESGKFLKKKMIVKKKGSKLQKKILTVPADGTNFLMSIGTSVSKGGKENVTSGSNELKKIEMDECNQSNNEGELQTKVLYKEISKPELLTSEVKHESHKLELCQNKDCKAIKPGAEAGESVEEKEEEEQVEQEEEEEQVEQVEQEEEESIQILESTSFKSEETDSSDYCILPDLMAIEPSTGSIINFGSMAEPHHRIMLFGGVTGFLKTMEKFNVEPNVRTLSLLLAVSPPTVEAEQKIIELAKSYNIKLDAPFFSYFIKRRIFRGQYDLIQDSLKEMQKANVQPDLICFGVLAFGCDTYEKGMELLENLKLYGYRANSEILYGLLLKAERAKDFVYVKAILDKAKADDVELQPRFIAKLGKIVRSEAQNRQRALEEISEN